MAAQDTRDTNIRTNTDTYLGVCGGPASGVTVTINGVFDSATVTLAYKKDDGTIAIYNSPDASGTSNFEVACQAGQGVKVYLKTTGGSGALDLDVELTRW